MMAFLGIVLTIAAVGQIALAFVFYNPHGNYILINSGWIIMMVSAIFGWLPIFTFRKHGKVEGRSYIQTTILVDRGVYSIVRHPQYLAGVLISLALPLITQHWLVALLGLIAAVTYYINTFYEERSTIAKFGDEYKRYMARVPRLNFILGILRLLRKK